jgi:hypothetical protein
MNPTDLSNLRHMLGVSDDNHVPNRNYFLTTTPEELEGLETAGLVERFPTPSWTTGTYFRATAAGIRTATAGLRRQQHTAYEKYVRADSGLTFAQYLGINNPVTQCANGQYRVVRVGRTLDVDVAGEWSTTKKEAKASYKKALASKLRRSVSPSAAASPPSS